MTKEDWAIAEKRTLYSHSGCKLLIDDYEVTVCLVPKTPYKSTIFIYINGTFKGAWLIKDCEERRRFLRPITTSLLKTKDDKEFLKGMSKKQRESWQDKAKYTYYWPDWSSFASLKKHLIANNTSIELINETEETT
ncbi:MAG: hypothetical protein RR234_02530 [Christensenella sp.]